MSKNRDRLKRKNFSIQTYALSGGESAEVIGTEGGKNLTDGSPMIITPTPPGVFGYKDEAWVNTYGASMDCFLSLYPGTKSQDSFDGAVRLGAAYKGIPDGNNLSLYEVLDGRQQVDFVVVKNTIKDARKVSTYSDTTEIRSLGVRGPIQMAGWGYTIGMRPTDPSPSDNRKNDNNHKLDMGSWKFGPVDLRWDDDRKCWRGYNDLIVDHSFFNQGTLIFSTNPDTDGGFPFLKGKLEDAFWVRKTSGFASAVGNLDDKTKSGELLTHLEHKWFDAVSNCVAPLSSIFKIHRNPSNATTVGSETTFDADAIELLTGVYFHKNDNFDGPIAFSTANIENDEIQGSMKLESGGQWIPVIPFDACDKVGNELGILFANDQALETLLRSTRKKLDALVIPVVVAIDSTATANSDSLKQGVQRAIEETSDKVINSISRGLGDLSKDINDVIADLAAQVEACLIDFLGGCELSPKEVSNPDLDKPTSGHVGGNVDVVISTNILDGSFTTNTFLVPAIDIAEGDLIDNPCP